jgi:hypothetical protein
MSRILQGYVIPKKSLYEVRAIVADKFAQSEALNEYMKYFNGNAIEVLTHIQCFDVGNNKVFFRIVAESTINELPFPSIKPEELMARFVHYDDRAESLTIKERAFCDKIDDMVMEKRYYLLPLFRL